MGKDEELRNTGIRDTGDKGIIGVVGVPADSPQCCNPVEVHDV